MRASFLSGLIAVAMLLAFWVRPCAALHINVEYEGTLFSAGLDPQAKVTIEAAAADLSAAVTSTFNGIPTDLFTGSFGGETAKVGYRFDYKDPQGGTTVSKLAATVPTNTVSILVGTRVLPGSTRGEAGPASLNIDSAQSSGSGNPNDLSGWPTAVNIASAKSESAYRRGGGPKVGNLSTNWEFDTYTGTVDVDYGVAFGGLALDNDSSKWHFDYTTPVSPTKTDLYSVTLHEMIHVLGFGASETWNSLASGTNWLGSEVIDLVGSGANLLASDGSHLAYNLMSQSIVNGVEQEVAMDPNILTGRRKYLTTLDLAFLRDLGYSTIMPTFSNLVGDFNNDGDVDAADLTRWKNSYALNADADADGDGDTDGADFLLWQRNYGASLTTLATTVPEPTTVICLLAACATITCRRARNASDRSHPQTSASR